MPQTFIIAEAGVNHNGSSEMARQLVDAAVTAGVDAIKFQTFVSEKLVSSRAQKAEYQKQTSGADETQLDMLRRLELNKEQHMEIHEYCAARGIEFISTPFDLDSARFLTGKLKVRCIKISSGDINNAPLLLECARSGVEMIISTGMSTLGDIETALGVVAFGYSPECTEPSVASFRAAYASDKGQQELASRISLLHCTTEYPAPFSDINLKALDTIKNAFGLPVGYSDHSRGISVPLAAVALGATVIEKHFTLDRSLPGPDHQASLEPDELSAMVKGIREIEAALGNGRKIPAPSELANMTAARRSIITSTAIKKGELFTEGNISIKRPGNGVSPLYYWEMLGKTAGRDYNADEFVDKY